MVTLEDQRLLELPFTSAQEVSQADIGDCPTPLEPKMSVESTHHHRIHSYTRQLACTEDVSHIDVAT